MTFPGKMSFFQANIKFHDFSRQDWNFMTFQSIHPSTSIHPSNPIQSNHPAYLKPVDAYDISQGGHMGQFLLVSGKQQALKFRHLWVVFQWGIYEAYHAGEICKQGSGISIPLNSSHAEFICGNINFFCILYHFSTGRWYRYLKSFCLEDKDLPMLSVNAMAADTLATQEAMASAAIILTYFYRTFSTRRVNS